MLNRADLEQSQNELVQAKLNKDGFYCMPVSGSHEFWTQVNRDGKDENAPIERENVIRVLSKTIKLDQSSTPEAVLQEIADEYASAAGRQLLALQRKVMNLDEEDARALARADFELMTSSVCQSEFNPVSHYIMGTLLTSDISRAYPQKAKTTLSFPSLLVETEETNFVIKRINGIQEEQVTVIEATTSTRYWVEEVKNHHLIDRGLFLQNIDTGGNKEIEALLLQKTAPKYLPLSPQQQKEKREASGNTNTARRWNIGGALLIVVGIGACFIPVAGVYIGPCMIAGGVGCLGNARRIARNAARVSIEPVQPSPRSVTPPTSQGASSDSESKINNAARFLRRSEPMGIPGAEILPEEEEKVDAQPDAPVPPSQPEQVARSGSPTPPQFAGKLFYQTLDEVAKQQADAKSKSRVSPPRKRSGGSSWW